MFRKTSIAALVAVSALSFAAPVMAQGIEIGRDGIRVVPQGQPQRIERVERRESVSSRQISERQAVRIARSEGVEDVDSITKTRSAYRIAGADRRGDDIRVDIDISSGEVLSVR
ncbi:hypothetical protein [Aurantimonas sp. Leaf443]|uniref:hypothetical protein n=1 Tax=Aurantimonas sp. Leaf443 TaxID=1736378 RepID=UPI0006FE43B0|nr:hypothetical protein [Aurantimonas sp. Leaf443]KQT85166.1 hypothetical protein ASG48_07785 [Aurantimonas sp. Leaf443]